MTVRTDFLVPTGDGARLAVREVRPHRAKHDRPVLLLHGARVPGIASFDLSVPGGSLAEDLARAGHRVLILDVRGYGASTRPPAMTEPPDANPPLMTGEQVVRDLDRVVDALRVPQVDLVGWATGGHWAAWYASHDPDRVRNLVVYNSLYGKIAGHPMLESFGDPDRPGEFDDERAGAYRLSAAADLLPAWDAAIPVADKTEWRAPAVARSYVDTALASDTTWNERHPPSFRAPNGAMKDSYFLATGRTLWDAGRITARTLVLRGEYDFWSRPGDVPTLVTDLTRARDVRAVELTGATHHAHLDRDTHGRGQLLDELHRWLSAD